MEMRSLYSGGPLVSVLGLGTVKLGRREGVKYPEPFDLPSDDEAAALLAKAKALGINLIDTAPAYGLSEERLGDLLQGQRDEWVIVTKAGETFEDGESTFDFTPGAIRASVERSLERLRTDRLDAVLIHSDGNDMEILIDSGALQELVKLREEGLIGAAGMSTKTPMGGQFAVQLLADSGGGIVMLTQNLEYDEDRHAIAQAAHRGVGVLIKKGLQSGHAGDVERSILNNLMTDGVSSMIVGTINPEHLEANAAYADFSANGHAKYSQIAVTGSEGLPIKGWIVEGSGNTLTVSLVVHGFMGSMERNIIPAVAHQLPCRAHDVIKIDLAHSGIGEDGDTIERLDEFERDSWRFTHEDIRAVADACSFGKLAEHGVMYTLIGHSRAGGAVVGYAGRARREGWTEPDAVVSLAGIGWYSIMTDEVRRQLDEQGYYRVRSKRAVGGEVRCGPSWFAEHEEPGDVFAEDVKLVRCPVLLINGEADSSVPLGHAERVRSLLEEGDCPRVELVTIPGADHNFNSLGVGLERENAKSPEVMRVADEIARFFDEVNPYRDEPT